MAKAATRKKTVAKKTASRSGNGQSNGGDEMTVSDEIAIDITAMHKWYGNFHVLKDINLKVQKRERIVICGPSGSGNPR